MLAQQRGHGSYMERETTSGIDDTWIPEQGVRIMEHRAQGHIVQIVSCLLAGLVLILSADGHGPH